MSDYSDGVIKLSNIPTLRTLYKQWGLPDQPENTLLDHVSLIKADITKLQIDAIVNAANTSLSICGAIHKAAGPELEKECKSLQGCPTGQAKITKGYELPAKHVIHAVGPIYDATKIAIVSKQLASAYSVSLDLAVQNSLKSVAFCSISTSIYGYPISDATHIALKTTKNYYLNAGNYKFDRIIFDVYSDADFEVYKELLPEYF